MFPAGGFIRPAGYNIPRVSGGVSCEKTVSVAVIEYPPCKRGCFPITSEQELGVNKAPFTHNTLSRLLTSRGITKDSPVLSAEAQAVLKAGYDIFSYYHTGNDGKPFDHSPDGTGGTYNHNAALYDIRRFFQGVSPAGRMKVKSEDEEYNKLIETLREKLRELRDNCIAPKVYEYGFLLAPEED